MKADVREMSFARGQKILRPFGYTLHERDGWYRVYSGEYEIADSRKVYWAVVNALEIARRGEAFRLASMALRTLGRAPGGYAPIRSGRRQRARSRG